jgi:hypothetical protein
MRGSPAPLALGLLLACPACTTASNVEPYAQPAQAPLSVAVGTVRPVRADGTVPRNERFLVQLDDYPDPDSVSYGPVTLRSGRANFDIDVSIDFVGRAVIVTPRSLMAPGAQYDLVVSGLVALDERVQGADVVGSVRVGPDDGDPFPAAPAPTWTTDVRPILATCAPACHSPVGASGRMRTPTRLLDLTGDPLDPVFGLVNVQSVGLRGTPVPLLRVAPGDPARSVLLRKLIGGSPQGDSKDPPYPAMRVDGRRMPLLLDDAESSGPPLPEGQVRTVQDWIAAGAVVQ